MSLLMITSSVAILFWDISVREFSVPLMCYWLIPNIILLIKMLCRIQMPWRRKCVIAIEILLWMCNSAKKSYQKAKTSLSWNHAGFKSLLFNAKATIWLFYTGITLVYPVLSFYRLKPMLLGFYSLALFWFAKTC